MTVLSPNLNLLRIKQSMSQSIAAEHSKFFLVFSEEIFYRKLFYIADSVHITSIPIKPSKNSTD